ncbi:MAG: hypothetical protein Q9227_005099 [Pyrenula ochraceoflavens]
MALLELLPFSPVPVLGVCWLFYLVGLYTYRLYFHPLAEFPGPKLAAASLWYEWYYDCAKRGQYLFKIKELHEQYGPVVRINPYELHFSDPEFFHEIYSQTEKRDAWHWRKKGFGIDHSTLTTLQHDLHRKRRSALNPLFSKQRIAKLQPMIVERVNALVKRIKQFGEDGEVIDFKTAFGAFTADVATEYFFGKNHHKIEAPDFDYRFHNSVQSGFNNMLWMNQFPWFMDLMTTVAHYTPSWVLLTLASKAQMTSFIAVQRDITIQVRESLARPPPVDDDPDAYHATMYDQLLSSRLPEAEKSFTRLVQEGGLMVGAATVSTAWSLTAMTYCLAAHPEALLKLKSELRSAFPSGPPSSPSDLPTLEHLPYLSAVLQESLRIGIGPSHRSPRISPDKPLRFTDRTSSSEKSQRTWLIPPGTPMCMSHPLLFRDPSIFPEPYAFRPERWIENPGLERYQFAFSKGTRACIGINLAMAEMYLVCAHLFYRFGVAGCSDPGDEGRLDLFETDRSDVECVGDGGVALAKPGSKGARFRVVPGSLLTEKRRSSGGGVEKVVRFKGEEVVVEEMGGQENLLMDTLLKN